MLQTDKRCIYLCEDLIPGTLNTYIYKFYSAETGHTIRNKYIKCGFNKNSGG